MIDLLVFGPHPDDLEIGMGGAIVATRQPACGSAVRDLSAGEMGSNEYARRATY
jgi:LmbE family N-acetylglucosaminyl deacetylase